MENTSIQVFNTTIKSEGEHIFIKPVCDFFQIEYKNQVEKILSDPILAESHGKKRNNSLFGDNYPRIYLNRKGFIRWIQLINPKTLPPILQESFLRYQADIFDFMYGTAEQESNLISLVKEDNRTEEELNILNRQRRLIKAELRKALRARYQYAINFNNQQSLNQ
jgi:hypothetical protein